MRSIINYIRSCFCKHEWEVIYKVSVVYSNDDSIPVGKNGHRTAKNAELLKPIKVINQIKPRF